MNQYLLRFSLPQGKQMRANELREALARTNSLPPEFFSYDSATGQPIRQIARAARKDKEKNRRDEVPAPTEQQQGNPLAVPGVRFIGGKTWVGVLATGEQYKSLLDQAVVPAIHALTSHCACPVPVEMDEREFSIKASGAPVRYWVREMVIKKGGSRDMDPAALRALIKCRIEEGLRRQASASMLDCPSTSLLEVRVREAHRPRGLRLVTQQGATNQYAMLVDVEFSMFAELKGFWFCGNLTARGYGRIGLHLGERTAALATKRSGQ